jgi:hypothetical protein
MVDTALCRMTFRPPGWMGWRSDCPQPSTSRRLSRLPGLPLVQTFPRQGYRVPRAAQAAGKITVRHLDSQQPPRGQGARARIAVNSRTRRDSTDATKIGPRPGLSWSRAVCAAWRVKDSSLGRHQPTDLQPGRTTSLTWGKALGVCSVGTHPAQRTDAGPSTSAPRFAYPV